MRGFELDEEETSAMAGLVTTRRVELRKTTLRVVHRKNQFTIWIKQYARRNLGAAMFLSGFADKTAILRRSCPRGRL